MVFVIDLDDTICDTDAFSEKYILKFFEEHGWKYKQIAKDVRFAEAKFDWDTKTAVEWYKKYGDEMMANFPCKEGAVEIINFLHVVGHKIVIATARANDWHTEPERITKEWIERNKIKCDKLCIGRVDKEKVCEEEDADVFVDDDVKITSRVAETFSGKKGKKVFLSTTDK